jgi:hypothetical protein
LAGAPRPRSCAGTRSSSSARARLRGYIIRQHRAGRPLSDILTDAYVRRCGNESFCWRVIQDPRTLHAFEEDVRAGLAGTPRS